MLRAWLQSDDCQVWTLYQKIRDAGISSVDQLLGVISAQLPRRLFDDDLGESAVNRVCKAYWDRVCKKFELGSEYENWYVSIRVMTINEFKVKTLERVKAGLWKLKLNALTRNDESVLRARLITLKEAVRLASKFKEVYVCGDHFGLDIRDICLASVVTFDTKGESFEWLLLGEDQIWCVRRSGNSDHRWYIYFGDGNVPEALDYKVDVKIDPDGTFYIFPLDDISSLLGPQDLETIKALVGK
jgi:hypothetical protein